MRAFLVVAAMAVVGSACYSTAAPRETTYVRTVPVSHDRWADGAEAFLTDGTPVRIKREATTREMVVIEPAEYRGRVVAIVSDDRNTDRPVVMLTDRQIVHRYTGSAGEVR